MRTWLSSWNRAIEKEKKKELHDDWASWEWVVVSYEAIHQRLWLAGVIVGTDGLPVLLRGVIWSGFGNGTMVSGLQVSCHSRGPTLATPCFVVTHHDSGSQQDCDPAHSHDRLLLSLVGS